jgi:hypothetical protein
MTTETTSRSSKSRWSARTIIAFLGFSVIARGGEALKVL